LVSVYTIVNGRFYLLRVSVKVILYICILRFIFITIKKHLIMKRTFLVVAIPCFLMLGLKIEQNKTDALIPERQMVQVGIIVKDVEKSARVWAEFLGEDEIPQISIASGSELNPTRYMDKPSDARARLAFFRLDNITIELIEPMGAPSTWQEFLDTRGEGIHHIAFTVNDMDKSIEAFEAMGIPMIQHGGWDTGEYGYFEGSNGLALIIELLENYE
jgi:catechol 2,3-dioxygenase-like lactoylglutathione lyase family enzyme